MTYYTKERPEWFVQTWSWNMDIEEYEPEVMGYYTEDEARAVYDSLTPDADLAEVSLIDGTDGRWDRVAVKPYYSTIERRKESV